ncbi:MAG: T9SS type A sorting domain-containing protein [Saprospiraceae bacterium]
MNRLLYLAFSLFGLYTQAQAQGYTFCNQVVGATGFAAQLQGRQYAWTVGEAVITTLPRPFIGRILTQGFHQPEFCQTVSAVDPALQALGLDVYPNPAVSNIHFTWDDAHTPTLSLRVFSVHGRLVEAQNVFSGKEMPCGHWPAGTYLLHLIDPATQTAAVVRIVKMDQ